MLRQRGSRYGAANLEVPLKETLLARLLSTRVDAMIAEARALEALPHAGLRGGFREILLRNIISPLLPATCSVFHGTVVDAYDARFNEPVSPGHPRKTEDDLIIVDNECPPPLRFSGSEGIVPFESVIAVIEVKSKLRKTNLKDAMEGAIQLRRLRPVLLEDERDRKKAIPQPINCLFAFSSDPQGIGRSEIDWVNEVLGDLGHTDSVPPIQALCVVGRGLWGWSETGGPGRWLQVAADSGHSEVLAFLGILLASLPPIRESRRRARLSDHLWDMSELRELK